MMVMTSAPFSAIAATTAPKSKLTALSDQINTYRDNYMNGQKLYTNMAAAYTSYINAVKVYDKAKYGADDVTQTEIENATSDLAAKCTAMTEWVPKTGTQRPSSSTKGFSDDSNTNTTVNNATTTYANGWRPFADNTGNKYVDDIYSSTYMNLGYFQSSVSSSNATWEQSNCAFSIYIPSAVIIYDGSDNFKARVGVMADYHSTGRKARKVAQIMVNGNDYLRFGDNWLQNAKSDGDTNFNVKERYEKRDFVGAIGRPSPTDRASGNATPDSTGTRESKNGLFSSTGPTYYLGNYIEFTVPSSASAFNTNTAASYAITSLPVQSKSGDTTFNDTWNGNVTVNIQVLNYSLLIKKMNAAKTSLRITESNPYLEGGLSALITALNNAMNEPQTEDEKKRSSARAAAMDEDADIESGVDGAAPRRETFAERRERLARERAAAEQEAATAAGSAGEKDADSDSDVDSDADVDAPQASAGEKDEEPSSESAAPARSVASLYAMKGTRKAKPAAKGGED